MKKSVWILLGVVVLLAIIIFWPVKMVQQVTTQSTAGALPSSDYQTTTMTMGQGVYTTAFTAEIADTSALQELGLSFRSSIDQKSAMIFVFPIEGNYKFWMKDMNFPLDIIWLVDDTPASANTSARQGKIIYIEKNLAPSTYPAGFGPDGNSLYVIEVASGTADRLHLSLGQNVTF
jgi:uncharacterized membrane protein (UPF0127 family)